MSDSIDETHHHQRCMVLHPHIRQSGDAHYRSPSSLLAEATGLAEAINLEIHTAQVLNIKQRNPRTLIGPGQIAECAQKVSAHDISVVIVNHSLSPTQQRNLERALKTKVIDRTALILEIFGERAQTREGSLQVELAALNYQKSRLVRSWTHLERQRGGFGFMGGPGESQIETDRRLIADRITSLKKQLTTVVRTRELHRKTRRDTPYPLVALVGYTNAGKSTLFNRLAGATVMAQDMLFATLDPTIRAITLPSGQQILLSDTVGFICDLPHELVAAFRATLEEVLEADIIVHVRDISHPDTEAQKHDVHSVLGDLIGEGDDRGHIELWNKIDQVGDIGLLPDATPDTILLSARNGQGCDRFLHALDDAITSRLYVTREYALKPHDGKALAWLHQHGHVTGQKPSADALHATVSLRPADAARFERQFLAS